MPKRTRSGFVIAALFSIAFASVASAQLSDQPHLGDSDGAVRPVGTEEPVMRVSTQEQAPAADDFLAQTAQESVLEWLWGETTQVDAQSGAVTVKYLDYDTDTEKEMVVFVDEKTTFENAGSVADIAPGDTLSIDYTIAAGTVRARNISVEKAVPAGAADALVPETAPGVMPESIIPDAMQESAENTMTDHPVSVNTDLEADPVLQDMPAQETESVPDVTTVPAD